MLSMQHSLAPELAQQSKLISNDDGSFYIIEWKGIEVTISYKADADSTATESYSGVPFTDLTIKEIADVVIDDPDVIFVVRKETQTQSNTSEIYPVYSTATTYEVDVQTDLLAASASGSLS